MTADDNDDSCQKGANSSPPVPSETGVSDANQIRPSGVESTHGKGRVDWDPVFATVAKIVGDREVAVEVCREARQRQESLPACELSSIEDPQARALDLASRLAFERLLASIDWENQRRYAFKCTDKSLAAADEVLEGVRDALARMSADKLARVRDREKYINSMVHNKAMDWNRDRRRQRENAEWLHAMTITQYDSDGISTRALAGHDAMRLLNEIKQPRVRQAFILCKWDGYTAKEAAEIMGIEEVTVRGYLAVAAAFFSTLDGHRKRERVRGTRLSGLFKRKEGKK
jgi:DNA-directed RNA polymerase specialized sigma24 family protein